MIWTQVKYRVEEIICFLAPTARANLSARFRLPALVQTGIFLRKLINKWLFDKIILVGSIHCIGVVVDINSNRIQ